jgi:hypothetical protein
VASRTRPAGPVGLHQEPMGWVRIVHAKSIAVSMPTSKGCRPPTLGLSRVVGLPYCIAPLDRRRA